jgi:glycosyltransferase involved in cell wall biosynthesis
MKMIAIADKAGRVQHNRLLLLQRLSKDIKIEVCQLGDNVPSGDMYYFSHFALADKYPKLNPCIASITSHKCLENKKDTLKKLDRFDRISVNNNSLLEAFQGRDIPVFYTPNGVDTKTFTQRVIHSDLTEIVLGWVGNSDRAVKNYHIIEGLKTQLPKCVRVEEVVTSKKQRLLSHNINQMKDYYHRLHFLLIVSDEEGTPNPGLEALSCGIPVITTKVGNMIDLVKDGENGFIIEKNNINSLMAAIQRIKTLPQEAYIGMSVKARESVESWDWETQSTKWFNFFKGEKNA